MNELIFCMSIMSRPTPTPEMCLSRHDWYPPKTNNYTRERPVGLKFIFLLELYNLEQKKGKKII